MGVLRHLLGNHRWNLAGVRIPSDRMRLRDLMKLREVVHLPIITEMIKEGATEVPIGGATAIGDMSAVTEIPSISTLP